MLREVEKLAQSHTEPGFESTWSASERTFFPSRHKPLVPQDRVYRNSVKRAKKQELVQGHRALCT
jgi:hypothetical protein